MKKLLSFMLALTLLALVIWMGGNIMDHILELALHGAVIYEMILGISAQKKLTTTPCQDAAA